VVRKFNQHYYFVIAAILIGGIILYFYYSYINRPMFALELDPTKDTTDISGTQYRIRLTNIGQNQVTGVLVNLGEGDLQNLSSLQPGQSYFFYPRPNTSPAMISVTTNEGLHIQGDYRSPTKVLGLPGAGR
jgi:hypothetical protein